MIALLLLTSAALPPDHDVIHINLGGDSSWTVTNSTSTTAGFSYKATVPGQIHTDLLAAGVIDEPFNSTNDAVQQWIAKANWTYERDFEVPSSVLSRHHVQLVSLGIDKDGLRLWKPRGD